MQLFVWLLDGQRYGLPYAMVERVVRAVEVTPLPDAPALVLGMINVQGRLVPMIDVRARFALPAREVALADQIVLAQSARRQVAFFVDFVDGLVEYAEDAVVDAAHIAPGKGGVAGVLKFAGGLILIHDLDRFLSLDDELSLDHALSNAK